MPPQSPRQPIRRSGSGRAPGRADGEKKGTVRPHRRRNASGEVSDVKKHRRKTSGGSSTTRRPRGDQIKRARRPAQGPRRRSTRMKQAGNVWAGTGVAGLVAVGQVLGLAFTTVTAIAVILAFLIKMLAFLLTGEEIGPTRRRRRIKKTIRRTTRRRRSSKRSTNRNRWI